MQRHKAGARVTPGGGSSNSSPSPAWQTQDTGYGGIKLYTPNEHLQANADISRPAYPPNNQVGMSNMQPPDLSSQMGGHPGSQHWDWTNGSQPMTSSNAWDWTNASSAQQHPPMATVNQNVQQQYSQPPTQMTNYDHSAQLAAQQQHSNWNETQHQVPDYSGAIHRSFSDVWNWGGDTDSLGSSDNMPPNMGQQPPMDMSQQYRQVPDGQDQGASQYSNWNQNQQVQYDWSQAQQFAQGGQQPTLVQTPASSSWNFSAYPNADASASQDQVFSEHQGDSRNNQDVPPSIEVSNAFHVNVQSSVTETHLNSSAQESLLPASTNETVQDRISDAAPHSQKSEIDNGDGSVATFFQYGEEVDIRETGAESEKDVRTEQNPANPEAESQGPNSMLGRAPYLRCDSWISNSSLLTYNRSTTGSQEFLSGSFFGEDGPTSMGSVSGLCQSVDDMHLSSHSLPYQLHHHPLHQSHPAQSVGSHRSLRRRSSVEEQILSLPLAPTEKEVVIPAVGEARRASLPNAILPNQEIVSDSQTTDPASTADDYNSDQVNVLDNCSLRGNDAEHEDQAQRVVIPENAWNQDSATNLEVPPIAAEVESKNASESLSVPSMENVEVIHSKSKSSESPPSNGSTTNVTYKLPGWSREGSAFQPPPSRLTSVTPVIQREAPDQTHPETNVRNSNAAELPIDAMKHEPESVNLETVPDNVERPLDTDGLEAVKKTSPSRSPMHSSFGRHHLRETHNSSPATSLWENPELSQDFGVNLAPAVLSTSSQSNQQQGILVVPQLDGLLDDPLSVTHSKSYPSAPKASPAPSKGMANTKAEITSKRGPDEPNERREVSTSARPSPPTAPLDLSSRAAPQGRSAADEDNVRNTQSRSISSSVVNQGPSIPPPQVSQGARHEESDRRQYGLDHRTNEIDSENYHRVSSGDNSSRTWSDRRRRYSIDRDDDYDQRSVRRQDYVPPDPRDERDRNYGPRGREWERDRERPPLNDPYYQYRYDGATERDRSRHSSRSSVQDYDANGRERYYDRGSRYPAPEDPRKPLEIPRPTSRGGYESDQGSERHNQPNYDAYRADYYQKDPRYAAYAADYYRYARSRYDPRYTQQQQQYYGANQYDYGYYAELYGSDPRYRAYYDSMSKDYYWQYGNQYGYDDYDRRSVHSGRSSVTDDSQKGSERFTHAFHQEDQPLDTNQSVAELSTIYAQDGSFYPQGVESSSEYSEHVPIGSESVSTTPPQRLTPAKFATPHVRATFSSSGQLVILQASSVVDGQAAIVEVCDLQAVLASDPIAQELNSLPGPLIRNETHKNDVIQYCQLKAKKASEETHLPDRDSCVLIWKLLMLLIRQNGIVVGTDIAELLMQDRDLVKDEMPVVTQQVEKNEVSSDGIIVSENSNSVNCQPSKPDQGNNKFIEFLLFGHKKDALEWAMKQGLWGHALFLASKMESRTYAMVMTRFANSLAFNDPLQTLYQLMSGRQPAAVTGIADEKWGDWRPHLAIILSNSTQRPELDRRSVVTLGDTLAAHGCLHAAHFCYLMAQMEFGNFDKKSSKLVLIGSNHSLPFSEFATTEAIKCTEVYEYVQSLANPHYVLPHLQFFKFIYATRLAEYGHPQEALHYCEIISQIIQKMPALYEYELVHQVYELAYRLKYYDPYYTQEEGEVADLGDPMWLRQLQETLQAFASGTVQPITEYSEHSTMDSLPNVNQSYVDPVPQDSASHLHQMNAQYQQQHRDSYSGQDVTQAAYTAQTYPTNVADNSLQSAGYGDYQNQPTANIDGSISQQQQQQQQQQPYDNYYGQNGALPIPTNDYSGQNTVNSQYGSYYGTTDTTQEFNGDTQDGPTVAAPAPNMDYYDISTRKNSLPPSPVSPNIPAGKGTPPSHLTPARKNSGSNSQQEKPKTKKNEKAKPRQGGSWLGGIFSKFSLKPQNQMILPDDKNPTLVWDPSNSKWVNTDGDEEEESVKPVAPPKDLDLSPSPRPATLGAPSLINDNLAPVATMPPNENRFKLRQGRVGMRQNYVDVLGGSTVPVSNALPTEMFPSMNSQLSQGPQKSTPQFFIPAPVMESDRSLTDFVTTGQPSNNVGNPGSRGGSPQLNFEENDNGQRSRTSSQSSLSREVQSYLPGQHTSPKDENSVSGQPLMYNPSQGTIATNAPTGPRGGLSKYGRYPR